ncbi:hypothetical protein [Flavobacterium sp.]|uniref:hypothetical protein n=1 Tax=Flavobacterium sp. TaxID=239 RepID=UPI002B4B5014|nr:hypothetical protein [Flavobacterium sp.]HLF52549.1 hypothetical protein [Flavobacterium sp.]
MKNLQAFFIVCLLICSSQSKLSAQTSSDEALVLQKSIDLMVLQQYYPKNQDNTFKPLVVLQHGVSFPTSILVVHHNNSLVFKTKADISNETAYFLFWEFQIIGNTARVEFSYNYNMGTTTASTQKVVLALEKSGTTWNITNTNIQAVQL